MRMALLDISVVRIFVNNTAFIYFLDENLYGFLKYPI